MTFQLYSASGALLISIHVLTANERDTQRAYDKRRHFACL